MESKHSRPGRAAKIWIKNSNAILKLELHVGGLMMAALIFAILTNVVTRYAGVPLYWIDELAVIILVWLAFIGASAMSRLRLDFAITFLADAAPPALSRTIRIGSLLLVLLFGLALAFMCWLWLDPVGIVRAGLDGRALAAQTFNFLYTERTMTLGWPRWAVMVVVPVFAMTLTLHTIASLLEEVLGFERTATSGFEEANG